MILPKFKLEKSYNLIGFLKSMGIQELFTETGNYSGISDEKVTINMVIFSSSVLIHLPYNFLSYIK